MAKAVSSPSSGKPGGRAMKFIALIVLGLLSLAAGAVAPRLVAGFGKSEGEGAKAEPNRAFVPFGEVVVNLSEERLTRYLRVKVMLVVDGAKEKETTEKITKSKSILRSWLIGHLSDKSLKEVGGGAGVNRLRREIREQFNDMLSASGSDLIQDVLFEEFVVQ